MTGFSPEFKFNSISISSYTAFCYYTASLNGTKMRTEQVLHMEENHTEY